MRTLILNAGYEPMQLVSWQRAICLVMSDKAEIVAEYGRSIRTVAKLFPMPSVVRLKTYLRTNRQFAIIRCSRKNIILRDGSRCQYCGVVCKTGKITIDHVIPRAKGGRTSWENVVAACQSCNHRKGDRLAEHTGMVLLRKPRRPVWHDLLDYTDQQATSAWMPFLGKTG
jgi:5-methylcytosine-specific restriction endonuclease McrA